MNIEPKVDDVLYAAMKSGTKIFYVHKVGREYFYVSRSSDGRGHHEKVSKRHCEITDLSTGRHVPLYPSETALNESVEAAKLWREVRDKISSAYKTPDLGVAKAFHELLEKIS